ncbi:hypothetical protein ACFTQ7_03400 [Lysinibacillus sp. NPDC056959]
MTIFDIEIDRFMLDCVVKGLANAKVQFLIVFISQHEVMLAN